MHTLEDFNTSTQSQGDRVLGVRGDQRMISQLNINCFQDSKGVVKRFSQ